MSDPVLGFDPQATAARLRNERAERLARWRWDRWAPPKQENATLASVYEAHPNARPAIESHLSTEPLGPLVVLGPPGTGKTWLALAVLRDWFLRERVGGWFPMAEMLDMLRPGGDKPMGPQWFQRTPLLILDDVGGERLTEWAHEQVDAIIDARWRSELPTIVTSNLQADALREHLGGRSWSRLTGRGSLILALNGPDRRKR